jgi:hypothetical protein
MLFSNSEEKPKVNKPSTRKKNRKQAAVEREIYLLQWLIK